MDNNTEYQDTFPRGALVGAALLIATTIALVLGLRLAHVKPVDQVQSMQSQQRVIASRKLKFSDADNGNVIVYAVGHSGKHQIAVIKPSKKSFLRAVMRGLAQARKLRGAGPKVPFALTELSTGQLILSDPVTKRHIYLGAFGRTNADVFARLLPAPARKFRRQQLPETKHD